MCRAVCGALLFYFPQLCHRLLHICFRHNLRKTPACLSCSTQTHTDMASPEGSGGIFLAAKSHGGLLRSAAMGVSQNRQSCPIPSFLPPSAVMECFLKAQIFTDCYFSPSSSNTTFISQDLTNQYMFHHYQVKIQGP